MNIISKLFSLLLFFMNIIHKIIGMPRKTLESSRKVTNGVASNGTLNSTRRCVAKEKSKQKFTNSGLANQAGSVIANQTQSVKKGIENSNAEAVEKSTQEKGYMRTTQSFSAKEKGKGKVEETQDLGKGKEVVEKPKPEAEPEQVIKYHLQWDGTIYDEVMEEEEEEEDGTCIICEQDLHSSPGGENGDEDEYGDYFEKTNLQEVGILGCGHCYHTQCLDSITPDDLIADPPCLICLS